MNLKEEFKDWVDADIAQFKLAKCLGIIPENANFHTDTKYLWWTDNYIGSMTFDVLQCLENEGLLKCRAEPDLQYKWVWSERQIMRDNFNYGKCFSIEEFNEAIKNKTLTDYNGFGYLSCEDEESDIKIYPSQFKIETIDSKYTHIIWYNRL